MTRLQRPIAFGVGSLSIALFSLVNALMKGLVLVVGSYNAMLWRTLIGAALVGLVYAIHKRARRLSWPSRPALRVHIVRGVVSTFMLLAYFWGLARVPLAQGIALAFIAPVLALLPAALILKERVSPIAVAASLIAFAGVVVIGMEAAGGPQSSDRIGGTIAVLIAAGCYAWNIILMRQQAQLADPLEVSFFLHIVELALLLAAAPFLAIVPESREIGLIGAAAILVVASQMLMAWAYARAEASYLAPVEYTAFVWASALGFFAFGEPISLATLAGTALIIAGCALATRQPRDA